MRILVTGAAGYLGSVLVPRLLSEGYEVVAIDSLMYGVPSLATCCRDADFTFHRGDVRDLGLMKELLARADVVIPLAAIVGAPACDRDEWTAEMVNLHAMRRMLEIMSPEQRIIYPTTNSGYGTTPLGMMATEEIEQKPLSLYAEQKVEMEYAVLDRGASITLRLATVFGASPRMRWDLLVNHMVRRAVEDGYVGIFQPKARRNYIHVQDIASAFIHCIYNFETMQRRAYNVGNSEANMNKGDLCYEIRKQLPDFNWFEMPGEDKDKRDYVVSSERFEQSGFVCQHSLADGIRELIKLSKMIPRQEGRNA